MSCHFVVNSAFSKNGQALAGALAVCAFAADGLSNADRYVSKNQVKFTVSCIASAMERFK
jgi:hypothetical protein